MTQIEQTFNWKERRYITTLKDRFEFLGKKIEKAPEGTWYYERAERRSIQWVLSRLGIEVEDE